MKIFSFPPVATPHAQILILGSMPGTASLNANQYYAHPRNLFWPIMGALFNAGPSLPYAARLTQLKLSGVALWDVMQTCVRATALDADIVETSIVANDFQVFLSQHPHIQHIYFNGAKAEHAFRRYVLPDLATAEHYRLIRLPSTSPANAAISPETRLNIWRDALLDVIKVLPDHG